MAHWLLKSEPDVFGYDDLVAKGREGWDGVRNYTARIHLRAMRKGDTAIFYHSNAKPPGAAGQGHKGIFLPHHRQAPGARRDLQVRRGGRARPDAVRPREPLLRPR